MTSDIITDHHPCHSWKGFYNWARLSHRRTVYEQYELITMYTSSNIYTVHTILQIRRGESVVKSQCISQYMADRVIWEASQPINLSQSDYCFIVTLAPLASQLGHMSWPNSSLNLVTRDEWYTRIGHIGLISPAKSSPSVANSRWFSVYQKTQPNLAATCRPKAPQTQQDTWVSAHIRNVFLH